VFWYFKFLPGEEQVPVPAGFQLASIRLLPLQFVELPPSGTSKHVVATAFNKALKRLNKVCPRWLRDAGLWVSMRCS
jgi:hypothetical protein